MFTTSGRKTRAFAIAAVACGCGGSASGPGEGEAVATLDPTSATLSLNYDGASLDALLIDSDPTSVRMIRVNGSTTWTLPLNHTDFGDYAQNLTLRINPSKTALVSGGNAYFLGMYGVTVAPLDGSTSATFYETHMSVLGAFAVDGGDAYASTCDDVTNSSNFGRFDANGTWELLLTGSLPTSEDTCANGAMTADADAVYWSTSRAIRAYSKSDGTVRTVVDLQGPTLAADPIAVNGASIVWFDWFDTSFHIASKTDETPAQSAALGATTLLRLAAADPAPTAAFVTDDAVYWLTVAALHRLTIADGRDEVLAEHPARTGYYMGLATDGQNVFFTDDTIGGADAGFGGVVLRSVPR